MTAELLLCDTFCFLQQALVAVGMGLSFAGQQLWVPNKYGLFAWLGLSTAITSAHQVPLDGGSPLPRIPEVFLEAASALEQDGRHQDSLTVCDEVISRTTNLIPKIIQVEEKLEQPECASLETGLAGGLLSQKRESLCCLTWRAAAYLHQGWVWSKLGKGKEAIMQFSR